MVDKLSMLQYRARMQWSRMPHSSKLLLFSIPFFLTFYFLLSIQTPFRDPTLKAVPQLLKWAKEGGMKFPAIQVTENSKGKAVIAMEDIPPGEVITVPFSLLLSGQLNSKSSVINSPGWKLVSSLDFKIHWTEALLLLYEKQLDDKSWFKPYVNTLKPRNELRLPFLWTNPKELQALEGDYIRWWLVNETRKDFNTYWPFVERLVRDNSDILHPDVFTYDNFEWAVATMWAHGFPNRRPGKPSVTAAIPVVDLLNHASVSTWWEVNEEREEWILKSQKEFKKGDELVMNYGNMANVQLMKWFGFAVENNPLDAFFFQVFAHPEDLNYEEKAQFLRTVGSQWIRVERGEFPSELLQCARVVTLTPKELDNVDTLEQTQLRISCANELASLKEIVTLIDRYFEQYSTTIITDEELLESSTISTNMRNAIILRKGHKKILTSLRKIVLAKTKEEEDKCLEQ